MAASAGTSLHELKPLSIIGPTLTLRYAVESDTPRLFELGTDAEVTRFFSWGPYTDPAQARAYIASLGGKRERGELLDFLVDHRELGPIGVTGLSELARRDRRATVGTWFTKSAWGSGSNPESKAMLAALAFKVLGMSRLTAWANVTNARSQGALERLGFTREGVLRSWHRHGDTLHDVVVYRLLRDEWAGSELAEVPVSFTGMPPPIWKVG